MATDHQKAEETDRLTLLPAELLVDIIEHVDVASHLNFACTCKKIPKCSAGILRRHRKAHDQYGVISDLQPATLPTLLRNIVRHRDPLITWHIRSLEIWGRRRFWEDWRPFMLQPRERFDEDVLPLGWLFEDEERAEYMRLFEDMIHPDHYATCMAKQQLDEGNDGILKVLLTALCPRLNSVKYVLCYAGNRDESLEWLASLIEMSNPLKSWAPGLRALREVFIGVRSGTWLDRGYGVHHPPDLLATILKLPSIDTVYIHSLYDHDRAGGLARGLSRGCSSVQHLFIDGAEFLSEEFRVALLNAPRSLKSLHLRGNVRSNQSDWDGIEKFLLSARNAQADSLESFMVHGAWRMRTARGTGCTLYQLHLLELNTFPHLRHVWLDNADLLKQAVDHDMYTVPELWNTPAEAALEWIISRLPASMEFLFLGNSTKQSDPEMTENLLIGFLKSDRFPRLKAIFIEDDVVRRERCQRTRCSKHKPPNNLYFQRLIALCEKRGVDVNCTASGTRKRIHNDTEIGFPAVPEDAAALKSLPLDSPIDGSGTSTRFGAREFNVFGGQWQPTGCGNCGECEKCFQVYSEESWKTREEGIKI
ncbi:hypothetical protein CSAL01_05613 [Colletotrichum salicis]|uniref:F-box domain-containing protein n=1 Tax=Colletotrichum salicis TaxID=1209931 RepID=A0A135V380_9PEZI|nr:hypothetical protein CSAL01_05613 [Colletotrichum salicis]